MKPWTYPITRSTGRAHRLLEPCTTCGAPPHAACVSASGRPVNEHGARWRAYFERSVPA
jgi:hypothetical protein